MKHAPGLLIAPIVALGALPARYFRERALEQVCAEQSRLPCDGKRVASKQSHIDRQTRSYGPGSLTFIEIVESQSRQIPAGVFQRACDHVCERVGFRCEKARRSLQKRVAAALINVRSATKRAARVKRIEGSPFDNGDKLKAGVPGLARRELHGKGDFAVMIAGGAVRCCYTDSKSTGKFR